MKTTLSRINKIWNIEPFKITALWNNGEVREIDFSPMFKRWQKDKCTLLLPLMDYEIFKTVKVSDTKTLCWNNVPISHTLNGKLHTSPLDLCPDTLYKESRLINKSEPLNIGSILKETRKRFRLTQKQIAVNCGTTHAYIARIEKGETNVQVDTLNRIIELGMGRKLHLEIL
ncbi:MAG: helix-turn-helix domain-containing protein [Bacteroidia bacterium]|nr:helix-turn-helix domain-containing protein [Bacteroidia bacterium]